MTCNRCFHSSDDHRMDDAADLDPTDPTTPFRCVVDGCNCPDFALTGSVSDVQIAENALLAGIGARYDDLPYGLDLRCRAAREWFRNLVIARGDESA